MNHQIFEEYKELRFCKLLTKSKKPFESDWTNKPYTYDEINPWIKQPNNYGVLCGHGGLIVIDSDEEKLVRAVDEKLPKTLRIKTGGGGTHDYYICDDVKKKIILENDKHLGEVQSYGTQVVGPGSIHPNSKPYIVEQDIPIIKITFDQLMNCIKPFIKELKRAEISKAEDTKRHPDQDINSIDLTSVLDTSEFKTARNGELFGPNPYHGSSGGMNTWINQGKNVGYCFRCNAALTVAKAIALNNKIISSCSDYLTKDQFIEVLKIANKEHGLKSKEKKASEIFTLRGQAEEFYQRQPYFYDENGIFWLWNLREKMYEMMKREEQILNIINSHTGIDTINSKNKTEILNALKQVGIKKIPEEVESSWIKFSNGIIDLEDGKFRIIDPSPDKFITNGIPWNISEEKDTPCLDKLFAEWVGEDYVKTLYQIIAYCLLPNYPLARIFTFVGEGMNGKSCFLNIVRKFLGENNITTTDLDRLLSSRFEVTRLHKKLGCLLSETNFGEMKQTAMLKQLTGNDLMAFEYKNGANFNDVNYAKILISTNSLPETNDKTLGFYRRWLILDFPHRFSEKKDILSTVPDIEFDNLCSKSIQTLRELLADREFHKEGSLEMRQKKYEDLSNPLDKFLKEFTAEDYNGFVWKNDFEKKFNAWCRENRLREMSEVMIGKKMKRKGIAQELKHADWMKEGTSQMGRAWIGLKWS